MKLWGSVELGSGVRQVLPIERTHYAGTMCAAAPGFEANSSINSQLGRGSEVSDKGADVL